MRRLSTEPKKLMKSSICETMISEQREAALNNLTIESSFDDLWSCMLLFQSYTFYTARKLEFSYVIKGGEIFVDRKKKSITRSTVKMAWQKVKELDGIVSGPKKLNVFGASYLYPVFLEFKIINKTVNCPDE